MKHRNIGIALALATALVGVSSQADDNRREPQDAHRAASGLQVVPVSPAVGEPGHGWQYFSDPRHARAVVISPGGDYYYSRGKGLHLVFKPTIPA